MNEEYYKAEISFLNSEIYRLNRQIEEERKKKSPDKMNPFDNPTEYPEFSGDYSDIMPELDAPDCTIPLEPELTERRKIRRFYSVGGWCVLGQFFISNLLTYAIVYILRMIISSMNDGADMETISIYMESSSIFAAVNMLVFLIANVGIAFMGMKMARIPKNQFVRTRNFSFGKAIQYCLIAFFLWELSAIVAGAIDDIFVQYGYTTDVMDMDGIAVTGTGFAVMTVYTCIIAPITEEIFFRGMLLRAFSRTNQRFAVFVTAFFFGISHHNIPQFVLAFIMGIFLAHITLKHNSIIPAVIVHIFTNTMSTLISVIEESAGYIFTSMLVLVIALMGFFLLCVFRENNKIPATTPAQSRRGFALAKSSVMFIIAVSVQVVYTIALIFM
ncbi:MAG: CPBP family intramembrane metalloprotease [Prevotella sp.]|nr:CPBP family intramembrane metalloprotease [Alistipes senegalensis]MCM1357402.1 CPBP family intramembrane metalloprotease [Prevotella sp.]MCM1472815.1 CPBP family intramembrane metalloprotease [Muribaculaceae bacterium]